MKLSGFAFLFALLSCISIGVNTNADIVVDASEIGGDVVFSGSGEIDLSKFGQPAALARPGRVQADEFFLLGPAVNTNFDTYDVPFSGPSTIGTGTGLFNASANTGDAFGFDFLFGTLAVPDNYVSNTQLSGTTTFSNQTFQSMGLANGSYVWSLGTQSVRLNINPVPEPGAIPAIAVALGLVVRRHRKS